MRPSPKRTVYPPDKRVLHRTQPGEPVEKNPLRKEPGTATLISVQEPPPAPKGKGNPFTAKIFNWLWQVYLDGELGSLAYRVAYVISQRVDKRKGYAFPSHDYIARMLGVSRRGVQKAIDKLVNRGHLEVEVSCGRGYANHYRLVDKKANHTAHFNQV